MTESDDEIMSYTPLKRKKLEGEAKIQSSQTSQTSRKNSRLSNISRLSQSSRCTYKNHNTNLEKSYIKNSQPDRSASGLSSNRSQCTFKKPQNVKNKSSSNLPKASTMKTRAQSNSERKGTIRDSVNTSKTVTKSQFSEVEDIFEEPIPDIDLNNIGNDKEAYCEQNKLVKITEYSDTSEDSDLLLNEKVKSNITQKEKSYKKGSRKNCNSEKLEEEGSVISIDSDSDLEIQAGPVSMNSNKIDKWLHSSLKYFTPKEVKTENSTVHHVQKNLNNDCSRSSNEIKTCVHLHFHLNSPKKVKQTTIDTFFKPAKASDGTASASKVNLIGSNSEEVMKTWKNLMNTMRGNSEASVSSKSVQKNNKIISSPAEYEENRPSGSNTCPFYKFIEDTNFIVDGFSYGHVNGVSAYFLSHFHYDHYRGLRKSFQKLIYCSQITANLVLMKINIQKNYVRPLPLEEPRVIDGVEVTLFDANHCPGAVMFLFKLTSGKTILHVGDFRANPNMENINEFWNNSIDVLYLDTTYLDPRYDFVSQEEVLDKCVEIARDHMDFNKQSVFLVGSYTIGKEKVFKAIATELDCKIFVQPYKDKILRCIEDKEIAKRLTKSKNEARVHVVPMQQITPYKLKEYMDTVQSSYKILVAIKPTGWEHNSNICEDLQSLQPIHVGNIYIYGIPYSEHSSFKELERFVKFIQPKKIIPTVNNGNAVTRKKMEKIFHKWLEEAKEEFSYDL